MPENTTPAWMPAAIMWLTGIVSAMGLSIVRFWHKVVSDGKRINDLEEAEKDGEQEHLKIRKSITQIETTLGFVRDDARETKTSLGESNEKMDGISRALARIEGKLE